MRAHDLVGSTATCGPPRKPACIQIPLTDCNESAKQTCGVYGAVMEVSQKSDPAGGEGSPVDREFLTGGSMTYRYKTLSSAVKVALSIGAIVAAGASGAAFAQDAASSQTSNTQKPKTLETITVTGSNIRRVDLETSNPVITI